MSIASTNAWQQGLSLGLAGGSERHSEPKNARPTLGYLRVVPAKLGCVFLPYSSGTTNLRGTVRQRRQHVDRCLSLKVPGRLHGADAMNQLVQSLHSPTHE